MPSVVVWPPDSGFALLFPACRVVQWSFVRRMAWPDVGVSGAPGATMVKSVFAVMAAGFVEPRGPPIARELTDERERRWGFVARGWLVDRRPVIVVVK